MGEMEGYGRRLKLRSIDNSAMVDVIMIPELMNDF